MLYYITVSGAAFVQAVVLYSVFRRGGRLVRAARAGAERASYYLRIAGVVCAVLVTSFLWLAVCRDFAPLSVEGVVVLAVFLVGVTIANWTVASSLDTPGPIRLTLPPLILAMLRTMRERDRLRQDFDERFVASASSTDALRDEALDLLTNPAYSYLSSNIHHHD